MSAVRRHGPRLAELHGAPVGKREQPADPPGDRVLGQRGLGELTQSPGLSLAVLDPEFAGTGAAGHTTS
jgi:hypothetical protein